METQTALIRTDRGVKLNAVASVNLNVAVIVNPGHTENDRALRLYHALNDSGFNNVGALLDHRLERFQNLFNGLMKLRLIGIALNDVFIYLLQVFGFK
jgi:hypothetical protein